MEKLLYAFEWLIVFILSVTLHEAAHALAAKKSGDLTAYAGGQVSLNPVPHIRRQPLGMLVFPFVSALALGWPFGFASTPYDPVWAYKNPRKAAWMAAAGPAANLLLVIICSIAVKAGVSAGVFFVPDSVGLTSIVDAGNSTLWNGIALFLSMMFTLNLILLVLNLIPLPPLDGSTIVSLFIPENAARKYWSVVSNPAFSIFGLLIAWQIIDPLISVAFPWTINLIYRGANFG